ncbi:translocon-associated protein subunit alpha [Schistosoma bovis]|uniref:Translocon-associated protein subunit alpha n=1 Tax=Schistosoma bovis TaxID=6184 RepID=A0A430QG98_SCHBO|nr:translocon-associated protein subunit alpha [Schistosoma bovis]
MLSCNFAYYSWILLLCSNYILNSFAEDATILSEEDSTLLPSVTNGGRFKGSPAVGILVALSKPPYGLYSGSRKINLPVGKISSLVASLANTNPTNGEQFKLDFIEGALHSPMYYDYHIHNFTKQSLHETLEPAVGILVALSKPPYGLYSGSRKINLPVGKISSLVASLANTNPTNGEQFKLDFIEGALHSPMYYDYHIHNFTKQSLHETLEPGQETSLYYRSKPAPELAGRSFDLSIVVYYHDNNDNYYAHKLFNHTVNLF